MRYTIAIILSLALIIGLTAYGCSIGADEEPTEHGVPNSAEGNEESDEDPESTNAAIEVANLLEIADMATIAGYPDIAFSLALNQYLEYVDNFDDYSIEWAHGFIYAPRTRTRTASDYASQGLTPMTLILKMHDSNGDHQLNMLFYLDTEGKELTPHSAWDRYYGESPHVFSQDEFEDLLSFLLDQNTDDEFAGSNYALPLDQNTDEEFTGFDYALPEGMDPERDLFRSSDLFVGPVRWSDPRVFDEFRSLEQGVMLLTSATEQEISGISGFALNIDMQEFGAEVDAAMTVESALITFYCDENELRTEGDYYFFSPMGSLLWINDPGTSAIHIAPIWNGSTEAITVIFCLGHKQPNGDVLLLIVEIEPNNLTEGSFGFLGLLSRTVGYDFHKGLTDNMERATRMW